jgi:hypothetical protein
MNRLVKKSLALLLIAIQLLTSAPAQAGLLDDLTGLVGNQVKQLASQQLANLMGVQGTMDPTRDRAMNPTMVENAIKAGLIFDDGAPLTATATSPPEAVAKETYDPANNTQTTRQLTRWKSFAASVQNKPQLNEADLYEASQSLLPFLRYYVQGLIQEVQVQSNAITVPGGQEANVVLNGYCMDNTKPAPGIGEKLQLVPVSKLIDDSVLPVYQAMMGFSAQHVEKRYEIQNLVWGLRHAADPYPPLKELNPNQTELLNAAIPGGAQAYTQYLQSQAQQHKASEATKQLYHQMLGGIQSKLGITLPDTTAYGYSTQDTKSLLNALTRMPIEGTAQDKSEYTLLSNGVGAKTVANGLHEIHLQIRNTSTEPYTFDADQFAGQSTRVTQRVAFGGIKAFGQALQKKNEANGPSAAKRLQDVLAKLEIPLLKRVQGKVRDYIEAHAGMAGDGPLKAAGFALATAINEVLLPTSVFDVAAMAVPGAGAARTAGKLEKLGAKEIAALEKAAVDEGTRFSRLVPGGGLAAHEFSGGHAIEKHVGKTEAELIARFQAEPKLRYSSSFTDRSTAEQAIAEAIKANRQTIDAVRNGISPRQEIVYNFNTTVGIVVPQSTKTAFETSRLLVVVKADNNMPDGYTIITAFPTK